MKIQIFIYIYGWDGQDISRDTVVHNDFICDGTFLEQRHRRQRHCCAMRPKACVGGILRDNKRDFSTRYSPISRFLVGIFIF